MKKIFILILFVSFLFSNRVIGQTSSNQKGVTLEDISLKIHEIKNIYSKIFGYSNYKTFSKETSFNPFSRLRSVELPKEECEEIIEAAYGDDWKTQAIARTEYYTCRAIPSQD